MRRWLGVIGVVLVLFVAAWAWPLLEAGQLARAAQAGDAAEVMSRVDVDALRRSLARQIAAAYVDTSGKARKLGEFGRSIAGAAATTVADPYVAELLTPENLTALLSQGRVNKVSVGGRSVAVDGTVPNLSAALTSDLVSIVTSSYYDQLNDFFIPVDGGHGSDDQFGVHMRRSGLGWRLGGLDLPAALVKDMAHSLNAGDQAAPSPASP